MQRQLELRICCSTLIQNTNLHFCSRMQVNWMRAGFLASDRNITVSPNYAREITTSPDRGVELDTVIRERGIEGIVNGVCNNVSF